MRFQAPQLGALGVSFTALRLVQFVALVTIIGLTANFINEIVTNQMQPPQVLVGTLVVTSIAAVYTVITYILYYDGMLPLLPTAGAEAALLIATIVVASTIGKPLSMINCSVLYNPNASTTESVTSWFTRRSSHALQQRYSALQSATDYFTFVSTDQPHCMESKAIWGLSIALCVFFAFSMLVCVGLWRRVKNSAPKDIEG